MAPDLEPSKNLFPTSPALVADTFARTLHETYEQPGWRRVADNEADYYDGNQLDSAALQKLQDLGIPPSVENLIAPAIDDILGLEAKNRTDFKVVPDGALHDEEADLVARAIGQKLNKAERASRADKACSQAYASQMKTGLGWVEVARNHDPFGYDYRTYNVHRNEIWWDWLAKEPDLSDARWLLRRRWTDLDIGSQMFPKKKNLIQLAGNAWNQMDELTLAQNNITDTTELAQSWEIDRGWTIDESEWRMPHMRRICIFELWTRAWEMGLAIRMPDKRVVEFDETNQDHLIAVHLGMPLEKVLLTRIYKTFMLGPHMLSTEQSEFSRFPYVPFWGKREDLTRVPYGIIRNLKYLQDEVNSRVAKMHWLLGAKRTVRTKDAVKMTDSVFRNEVGRPDADIVLDAAHMGKPGATFEIQDDMALNRQQFERLQDLRESIKHISGVSDAFSGDAAADNIGALNSMVEQTVQSLAFINDNYADGRIQVGELLMGLLIRDMGSTPEQVMLYADNALRETIEVTLNQEGGDPETGRKLLTNDVQRTKLKVALEEVPQTPSYRRQALVSLSEAFKAAGQDHQQVMLPHLMNLTDVPDKEAIIEAILEINRRDQITPEEVEERIKAAVEEAKVKWMVDQKDADLELKRQAQADKAKLTEAQIKKLTEEAVAKKIESIYSGVQTGAQIVTMPGAAGAADQVLNSAGFEDEDQQPIVAEAGAANGLPSGKPPPVRQNTSPGFPPRLQDPESAVEGAKQGIEKKGAQDVAI